jgi:3'-5' exoribonuclease 1
VLGSYTAIQDTRNVARIVIELARRGVRLQANTFIRPGRRWNWMGKSGQILEDYV